MKKRWNNGLSSSLTRECADYFRERPVFDRLLRGFREKYMSYGYYKSITVNGILASDAPIISTVLSGAKSTDEAIIENWNCISRIVPSANKITVYAYGDKPTVNIPIQILCVRG